eukprot:EG_transcript_25445
MAYHLHQFASHADLVATSSQVAAEDDIDLLRCIQQQASTVFVEATPALEGAGLPGAAAFQSPAPTTPGSIYEFRQYQLRLGYDTVPSFLKFYSAGLPSKLRADPRATLVTVLYSDLGVLNTVIEVWRHDSVQAMMDSRVASRGAQEWRSAIASIASLANSFHNNIFHPRPESRWK